MYHSVLRQPHAIMSTIIGFLCWIWSRIDNTIYLDSLFSSWTYVAGRPAAACGGPSYCWIRVSHRAWDEGTATGHKRNIL